MKHLVIPDTQIRPGVPFDHMRWAAQYALAKRPDVIIHLGDHWDFPSLSAYRGAAMKGWDKASLQMDIAAGNEALWEFDRVLLYHNVNNPRDLYTPTKYMLRGNHEHRLTRAREDSPWLACAFDEGQLADHELGWTVVPFLEPLVVDGIRYCHYFCRNAHGRVCQTKRGMPSAKAQVVREAASATAGHQQGLQVHIQPTGGRLLRGIIAGSFYEHEEDYLSPQGNAHWRGILLKHDVSDGEYDLCEVGLSFLRSRYAPR